MYLLKSLSSDVLADDQYIANTILTSESKHSYLSYEKIFTKTPNIETYLFAKLRLRCVEGIRHSICNPFF